MIARNVTPILILTAFSPSLLLVLAACGPGRLPEQVIVSLTSDGETQELTLPQGSTVRDALRSASVTLAELDRVRPPETSLLTQRHGHHRDARHSDQRTMSPKPSLPTGADQPDYALQPGESHIMQAGRNGELTTNYRLTYEDGELISRVEVGQEVIATPVPEIVRVGLKEDFNHGAIVRHAGLSVEQQRLCHARHLRQQARPDHRQAIWTRTSFRCRPMAAGCCTRAATPARSTACGSSTPRWPRPNRKR